MRALTSLFLNRSGTKQDFQGILAVQMREIFPFDPRHPLTVNSLHNIANQTASHCG